MLDPAEKIQLKSKKREFEGSVPHMYLCTAGHVTVGIGHKIENESEATRVKFLKTDGIPASPEEIKAEYIRVKSATIGRNANFYEVFTRLHISEAEIIRLTDNHLNNFYRQLKELFPEFDDYPKNIRFALFDMIYNLGKGGLRDKFPKFGKAVRNRNWSEAANESSRTGIGDRRNQYVAGLLRSEAGLTTGNMPQKSLTSQEIREPKIDAVFSGKKPQPVKIYKNIEIQRDALKLFPEFSSYPLPVRLGLIDMLSTLGANKLKQQFPKFMRAIKNRDWLSASRECSRKNQKSDRNNFVADLFKSGYPGQFKLMIRK
jgi:GH24 family phage-related lysozyme (muramidase)